MATQKNHLLARDTANLPAFSMRCSCVGGYDFPNQEYDTSVRVKRRKMPQTSAGASASDVGALSQ